MEQDRLDEALAILEKAAPRLAEVLGATDVSVAYVFRDHAEVCFAQVINDPV